MQHEILERLHRDHINMVTIIRLIGDALDALEHSNALDLELLEDALEYITEYPDVCHHPTEDVVFKRLVIRDPQSKPAVDALLDEHDKLIESGRSLLKAVRAIATEALVARAELIDALSAYIDILSAHIDKEESGLLVSAATHLEASDWAAIADGVSAMQDPVFGATVDEDHRRLWQRISTHASSSSG